MRRRCSTRSAPSWRADSGARPARVSGPACDFSGRPSGRRLGHCRTGRPMPSSTSSPSPPRQPSLPAAGPRRRPKRAGRGLPWSLWPRYFARSTKRRCSHSRSAWWRRRMSSAGASFILRSSVSYCSPCGTSRLESSLSGASTGPAYGARDRRFESRRASLGGSVGGEVSWSNNADLHDHGPQGQVDASARLRQRG
jgi:hypothetical protein